MDVIYSSSSPAYTLIFAATNLPSPLTIGDICVHFKWSQAPTLIPEEAHSIHYGLHSSIRIFDDFMDLFQSGCSIICIHSSFWKTSCNFLPWDDNVGYFTEHFDRLDVVMQRACCDLLTLYSFFLIMQGSNDIIKCPIRVISSFMDECIASFPECCIFVQINSIKETTQSSEVRFLSIR